MTVEHTFRESFREMYSVNFSLHSLLLSWENHSTLSVPYYMNNLVFSLYQMLTLKMSIFYSYVKNPFYSDSALNAT